MAKRISFRRSVQVGWTLLTNGYLPGFLQGRIYTGRLKSICVPGLNCYSCPGAFGSCPIGSLQAVMSSARYNFSFYVFGFLLLVGGLFGRLVCGFLCPFGLLQDLLHKIPFVKKIKTFPFDKQLRYLKYAILLIFVLALPLFATTAAGIGIPWFCKYICPAGTLMAGLPLITLNPWMQGVIGVLFFWKLGILIFIVLLSIVIFRPFCKYICPLGAIYAMFNKVSLFRYRVSKEKCVDCKVCNKACEMNISPYTQTNHPECIRCGDCKKACKFGAITSGFKLKGK